MFSSQQLLQVSQMMSEEFSPGRPNAVPELVLMPVDPYHLHAYWHIGGIDIPVGQKGQRQGANNDLRLRVYCQQDEKSGQSNNESWFDVAVGSEANCCDVRLPLDNLWCRAAIGTNGDNEPFIPLLLSKHVRVPKAGISAVPTAAAKMSMGAQIDRSDRHFASPTNGGYDERLIDALIRQALSDQNIQIKLNPHANSEWDKRTEQIRMAPALSSHANARRTTVLE